MFINCIVLISFGACLADDLSDHLAFLDNYEDYANYEDLSLEYDDYDLKLLSFEKSTCKRPKSIKNGKVDVWGDDLLLEYTCNEGFVPYGITHGACNVLTKEWTIEPVICVSTDCNFLLPPRYGIVTMDKNKGVASITCESNYTLVGSPVLYCRNGKWIGRVPLCAVLSEIENHSGLNATEEEKLHTQYVQKSDESCFHYHIEPPKILYSLVITSYVMNSKRKRYVMVAKYSCVNGYRLLNGNAAYLYCKNSKWSAEIIPKCIPDNDPCEVDNGGCQHNCVFYRKTNKFTCTCKPGFTLGADAKVCIDINECLIQNGGCPQLCINAPGSYTCTCHRGYIANGTICNGK